MPPGLVGILAGNSFGRRGILRRETCEGVAENRRSLLKIAGERKFRGEGLQMLVHDHESVEAQLF